VALERKTQTAAPAFERRRAAPATVRRSAAPAPSTARSLQVRLGNQATQSVARSLQSSKAAAPPAKVAKKNELAEAAAEATAKAAVPVLAETEQEAEKKPAAKGKGGEKAAPPSPRKAIAPAVKAVKERSSRARKRGNEKALVGSAQAAAKNPDIEGQRDASVATVTTLDDAKKTAAKVRRDKFKADLTAALKAATESPKTKEQAEQVVKTGGKDASNALKSSLAEQRDAAAGGMKGAQATEVAPSPSGTQVNMESDAVGAKPAPVSAAPIVPAPLPPERLDYSSDRESTDTAMEESGVTTEQLGKGNEPQFNKTLSERSAAEKHEAAAEAKYRQSEAGVQAEAKADAQGELALQLAGIHGSRELHIGQVTGQQNATKTKDAQERERVTNTINDFKDKTRNDVGEILRKMDEEAATIFEAGLGRAEKAYEDTFEKAKGGWWTWLTTDDWDEHINESLEIAKVEYYRQVDLAINDVANLVDAKLEEAKARVAVGRQQVEDYVKTLHGKVKEFGDEALNEVKGDFDAMESEIDQRRDALIDNLTQQFRKSYERMSAKEEALREANKSFWQRVYDATVGVIKKILAFKDMLVSTLAKAASVVVDIISDPIGFLGNLVSAVMRGLENFMANIATHLEKGLMEWLFGALGGAGLKMPEKFDLAGIISIVLQVLGLTWENFRARAVAIVGAPVVETLEKTAKVFEIVRTQGVAGLWEFIKEKLLDLKSMVMDAVLDYIKERVLIAGVTWIISLLNPASAFFKACKAIYDIVKFFIERATQIMALINAIIDSIAAIAKGQLDNATKKVENALAKAIPVAIGFLAALLGLGDISGTIRKFIDRARQPVNKAIDWVITTAAKGVKALVSTAKAGVKALINWWKTKVSFKAGGEAHSLSFRGEGGGAKLILASAPTLIEDFLTKKEGEATSDEQKKAITEIRALIVDLNKVTTAAAGKEKDDVNIQKQIEGLMNEMGKRLVLLLDGKDWGTEENPTPFEYPKRRAEAYPTFYLATGSLASLSQAKMAAQFAKQAPGANANKRIYQYRPTEKLKAPDDPQELGLGEGSQITVGRKLFFSEKEKRGGGVGKFKRLVAKFGFVANDYAWDIDHVVELQLGGKDEFPNLWPLPQGENRSSGAVIKDALLPIPGEKKKTVKEALKEKEAQGGLWLMIKTTRQL